VAPGQLVVSEPLYDRLVANVTDDDLSHLWKVGDIVTRDGTDEHEIVGISEDMLDLVCIKEPADKWIAVGERDSNLARRYSFVRPGNVNQ
jgi:hypothetical protein